MLTRRDGLRLATALAGLSGIEGLAAPAAHSQASAQDTRRLRMGVGLTPNSIDPHYHNTGQNNSALRHVFDTLVNELGEQDVQPCLALSWRLVDDLTWEFKLRPDVVFSDGTPFVAEDVVFSFQRVPTIPNSPGLFTPYVKLIKSFETPDAHTVLMRTEKPYPFVPRDVAWVQILSHKIHAGATTDDFNSLKVAIGTGPYRIVKYTPGDAVELVRSTRYWGPKQPWATVQLKAIAQPQTRLIALESGDLDVIGGIAPQDLPRAKADPSLAVQLKPSVEVVYLFPDSTRDISPNMTDKAGKPLTKNPMRDVRVRRALSMSIDRKAIVARVMQNAGAPAYQIAAATEDGYDPSIPPIPYDPAGAKKLLAEAGWPDGWKMTIDGPVGFISNDDKILQAVGSFFSRIGVETNVQSVSPAVYFGKATAREYCLFMTSFSVPLAITDLKSLIVTKSAETGDGPFNRQLYSNKKLDDVVFKAQATLDPVARRKLIGEAMRIGMDDVAVIPLINTQASWATRKAVVTYDAVPLGWAWAMLAKPV
jgi:peptide/nickel transport system substrate-binding protein